MASDLWNAAKHGPQNRLASCVRFLHVRTGAWRMCGVVTDESSCLVWHVSLHPPISRLCSECRGPMLHLRGNHIYPTTDGSICMFCPPRLFSKVAPESRAPCFENESLSALVRVISALCLAQTPKLSCNCQGRWLSICHHWPTHTPPTSDAKLVVSSPGRGAHPPLAPARASQAPPSSQRCTAGRARTPPAAAARARSRADDRLAPRQGSRRPPRVFRLATSESGGGVVVKLWWRLASGTSPSG